MCTRTVVHNCYYVTSSNPLSFDPRPPESASVLKSCSAEIMNSKLLPKAAICAPRVCVWTLTAPDELVALQMMVPAACVWMCPSRNRCTWRAPYTCKTIYIFYAKHLKTFSMELNEGLTYHLDTYYTSMYALHTILKSNSMLLCVFFGVFFYIYRSSWTQSSG